MTEDVTKAQIGVTHDGHVVVVELLAGPHNFASVDLMNELGDALIAAQADGARAAVVCSEGKSFCAGGDLAWLQAEPDATVDALRDRMMPFYRTWLSLRSLDVPSIAAVNGAAVGAGGALALSADIRYAGAAAKFTVPFGQLGMHAGMATTKGG